jgi:5'-nucleotidase / UDP-sugar diphosphatase
MKKHIALFLSLMLVNNLFGQNEKRITILHTNDLHSRLTGFAPESAYTPLVINNDKTRGGFARIASVIKSEKGKTSGTTLVLDAGDFLMGTMFTPLEPGSGFQLTLMKKMGYDAVAAGNHEYDYGPDKLGEIIRSSASNGEIPTLLAGNAVFDLKDPADDNYEKLFSDKLLARKLVLSKDGIKFGIFSLLGEDAERVAPNASPVTFAKRTKFAKKMVKELQNEGCEVIICISHSGIEKDKKGEWSGEDTELARKVKGLDLIVGGHSHSRLDKPLIINGIPIVQTGEFGQNLGKASFLYDGKTLRLESYELIAIDDSLPGDEEINSLIEARKEKVTSDILSPHGLSYDKPVAESDFIIEGNDGGDFINSNLGPAVVDAIHYYVNKHSTTGTDISMVAAGMLFDKIVPGIQTAPDLFRVMSLGSGKDNVPGYPLSRLYVTGKELKSIIEILLVAYKSSPDNYCYYSGVRVDYDPEKGLLRKIKKIEIVHPDGSSKLVDFSKKNKALYSVTANSYMLQFIGIIKKSSFGLINVVPKDAQGNPVKDMTKAVIDMDEKRAGIQEGKEWLALVEFFGSMKDINGNGIPDIDKKYSVPVRSFFTGAAK